jgi:hypothetical protein
VNATRAEICVVACAEAWRGDGATLASPMGLIPTLGARLARLTFAPASISRRAWSGSLTSARVNEAVRSPAAGRAAGSLRAQTITCAPERRNPWATPAPMPLVPPVTITRRPERPGNGWSTGCMAPC